MDNQGRSDNLHMLVGELTGTVKGLAEQVSRQVTALDNNTHSLGRVESGLKQTNEDLKRLHAEMIRPDDLRQLGISHDTPTEMQRDFAYLRRQRETHDARKPIATHLKTVVISLIVTSILTIAGKRIMEEAAPVYIGTAQDAQHQSSK
jgi:hypothetical protein